MVPGNICEDEKDSLLLNFEVWFQNQYPQIPLVSCKAVLELAAEEATVPFIARYRKEKTGNLDELKIQQAIDAHEEWNKILRKQQTILHAIELQKKLTPELKEKIQATFHLEILEDIYLPYRQKRKSKSLTAKEAGLDPFAEWVWNCAHGTESPQPGQTLELWAFTFRNIEKGFSDSTAVIEGAKEILIEKISESQDLRQQVRDALFKTGTIKSIKNKVKPNSKFENYFDFQEPVHSLRIPQNSHRYLAMRRGWMEEELTLTVAPYSSDPSYEEKFLPLFQQNAISVEGSPGHFLLLEAARIAYKHHVFPSIENEVHKTLKEIADQAAIEVFAQNVRKLLTAAPFGPHAVLGVDPGIRTGCKLAVVNDSGRFVANTVIHLIHDEDKKKAASLLASIVLTGHIKAIAVGNGTAGRETEIFIRNSLKEQKINIPVVMVSEAGASVYSASEVAREEFPDLDVTIRGAISIARRLQDPLSELVKIDPKSIGVGQYQHDVAAHSLKKSLDFVVDSCVNTVGVNLNTASHHLLSHVAGIGPAMAKAIIEFRGNRGLFKSRQELLKIPRFSKRAFEQAAGFLRIPGGESPLDNTGVHPEKYLILENFAKKIGKNITDFLGVGIDLLKKNPDLKKEIGDFSFGDIIKELERPGRDPRDKFTPFHFREDIHELKDLKPGMICPGIVTNVANFGVFVDIGVHQDGLVHISEVSDRFIKDPREIVSPGDTVKVSIIEVKLEKSQISLTMKINAPKSETRQYSADYQKSAQGGVAPERRPSGLILKGPMKGKPSRPPKQLFNNPFGALAALKKDLKSNKTGK